MSLDKDIIGIAECMKVGKAFVATECDICHEVIHNGDTLVTDWRQAKAENRMRSYHRECIDPKMGEYPQAHNSTY